MPNRFLHCVLATLFSQCVLATGIWSLIRLLVVLHQVILLLLLLILLALFVFLLLFLIIRIILFLGRLIPLRLCLLVLAGLLLGNLRFGSLIVARSCSWPWAIVCTTCRYRIPSEVSGQEGLHEPAEFCATRSCSVFVQGG
jgi:hypothetical protein